MEYIPWAYSNLMLPVCSVCNRPLRVRQFVQLDDQNLRIYMVRACHCRDIGQGMANNRTNIQVSVVVVDGDEPIGFAPNG